jgi:predicted MFS family arabinose efflux permease
VVAAAFLGAGHALILPIVTSLIIFRSRASERGSALAIFAAFVNLAAMFSSPIIGAIIEASGYRAAFSSTGVVVALAVIGFYRSDRAQSGYDPRPIE